MASAIYSHTGFHSAVTITKERVGGSEDVCRYNCLVVSGYIPGIGILMGAMRCCDGFSGNPYPLGARVYFVCRGILEICGLGLLFLIPDLIVSICRHFCAAAASTKPIRATHIFNKYSTHIFNE